MEALISVVVPVYNVKDYVEKCLSCILNQTYSNLEILIFDDFPEKLNRNHQASK